MNSSEYAVGRRVRANDGTPVGEAHAVLIEAAKGDGPYRAECGEHVDAILGGSWPPGGPDAAGPCPVCSRLTGA
jgi:hypothetical protein